MTSIAFQVLPGVFPAPPLPNDKQSCQYTTYNIGGHLNIASHGSSFVILSFLNSISISAFFKSKRKVFFLNTDDGGLFLLG